MSEPTIAEERARELLGSSSSSVASDLEQAEGWIHTGQIKGEPDRWRVDAVAGAIGVLANAYGRLTLWCRLGAGGQEVEQRLEQGMETLVALRRRLEHSVPRNEDVERLNGVLSDFRRLQESMRHQSDEESRP